MSLLSDDYVGLQIPTVSGLKLGTTLVADSLLKGGGVIYDFTVIALDRVIGPNTRFIDTRV